MSMDDVVKGAFTISLCFVPYPEITNDPTKRILCVTSSLLTNTVAHNPLLAFRGTFWFVGCHSVDLQLDTVPETLVDGIRLDDIFEENDDRTDSIPVNIRDDPDADALLARAADIVESSNILTNFIVHTQTSLERPSLTVSQASAVPSWDDEIPQTPKSLDAPISNYLDELWV